MSAIGEALDKIYFPSFVSGGGRKGLDVPLLLYFVFWYAGNYFYNIQNKVALKASGGATGFPMTVSALQLGVGVVYALFLWMAPDARKGPILTTKTLFKMLPVAFCTAAAHSASVFALSAGAVSFGQIVKAAEPAFAAVVATAIYGKTISLPKWFCLIPVIGGVCLASVKELDFAYSALISASLANLFAAFKSAENKKLMEDTGLKAELGSVGNQFAVTTILAFLISLPVMILKEGDKMNEFAAMWQTDPVLKRNVVLSGLTFYAYNELATLTLKKTSGVTQSVANTAKRVIIIVGTALVFGESMSFMKMLGCGIGIGGVFLYSSIESLLPSSGEKSKKE
uniref:Sugar phosphate transporter domain-containing protein n=1 Tax=Rhizochromulina marina TaxID=1034831 RepID=A0A7S2RLD5_9STRA